MATDYLAIFTGLVSNLTTASQAAPAGTAHTQSEAQTTVDPYDALEREAIQWEGRASVPKWVEASKKLTPAQLAKVHPVLCRIIDAQGESAAEEYLLKIVKKIHNRA